MRLMQAAGQTALYRMTVHACLLMGLRRQATDCLAARLRQVPGDVHALATQAHLLAEHDDNPAAQALLVQLLKEKPDDCVAWFNLGYLREQRGEAHEAEAAFRCAIDLSPRMDRAWYGLALCLMSQERWDDAEAALRRTTELQPWGPAGWVQLARVMARRGDHGAVQHIIENLRGFDPRAAAALAQEAGLDVHGQA